MNASRSVCVLSMLLVCGCTTTATRDYRAAEEPKILEAALLQQLTSRDTNRVVFVSFSDSQRRFDPPDSFIERLSAAGVPARKASQSTTDDHTLVVDRTTREPGAIYSAALVRWVNNLKVEVSRGVHIASLAGGATTSVMEKKDGEWRETKIKRMLTY